MLQKNLAQHLSKSKTGYGDSQQFPIKGRPLPSSEVFDGGVYNPKHSAVRAQEPSAFIGTSDKFFNLNFKEVSQKQGPNTYRPNHETIMY